jgi:hypothetical protein
MAFADQYLARHAVTAKIPSRPAKDLRQIIVIPCLDEPALVQTLDSLWSCNRPSCAVEVIIVVNSPADAPADILSANTETLNKAGCWITDHHDPGFTCHLIHEPSLPAKYAGPGLARKIGMDQAVYRYHMLNNPGGIIISLDADTTCRADYLKEIERRFMENPEITGCTIYFEHPLAGDQFSEQVRSAIAAYELHLRYYIEAIRRTGFPHAFHTIGSAFCVPASAYVDQGGMNKRKAGEDFYFLQKIIPAGQFTEINTTCVYPSPRPSGRVPFGTGAMVKKYVEGRIRSIDTYNPDAFGGLSKLFAAPSEFFRLSPQKTGKILHDLPQPVRDFAGDEFLARISEINNNCATPESFLKRFLHWFNMFKIMKYLNFVHPKYYTKIPAPQAAHEFLRRTGHDIPAGLSTIELLEIFRKIQREEKY